MLVIKYGCTNNSCVILWKSGVTVEKRKELCKFKGTEALGLFGKLGFFFFFSQISPVNIILRSSSDVTLSQYSQGEAHTDS